MIVKVSVIMPSLNVVNYIRECLQSVLNQTLREIEIICVDAGSTDGTVEIINELAKRDKRIKIIHSDVKSYGYQMNLGLRVAQGQYVGIVETDDVVSPEMFEKLYDKAIEDEVDFIKSNYTSFFCKSGKKQCIDVIHNKTLEVCNQLLVEPELREYCLTDINHIWSAIYKRDFLISNCIWFNETPGASFQDTSFSIIVGMMAKKCVYVPDCFYQYRIDRPGSSVKSDKKVFCVIDEFRYVEQYLLKHRFDKKQIVREISSAKIQVYWWNMMRLSKETRGQFHQAIVEELKQIIADGNITKDECELVKLLINIGQFNMYVDDIGEKTQHFLDVIYRADLYNGYVVAGAGRFLNKVNTVQKLKGKCIVKAVCDNDSKIQNLIKADCRVLSVKDAIEMYKNEHWLILNRKHGQEIMIQLLNLGIDRQKIDIIDYIPELTDIYEKLYV